MLRNFISYYVNSITFRAKPSLSAEGQGKIQEWLKLLDIALNIIKNDLYSNFMFTIGILNLLLDCSWDNSTVAGCGVSPVLTFTNKGVGRCLKRPKIF